MLIRLTVMAISISMFIATHCRAETSSALTPQSPPTTQPKTPQTQKLALKKQKIGRVKNVTALGDIYLAGQPTPTDLPLFKQQGIKTIITLRKPEEVPWDEAAAVKQQGMKYIEVPFQRPEELQPKVFDEVLKVLRDKKRGPTVLHCGSANRVGAIWYAYRILDGKLAPEAALKEAQAVGLRTPAYLLKAQAYVDAMKGKQKILDSSSRKKDP